MHQFKPLEWNPQVILAGYWAEPSGLKWRYSIIIHRDKSIEFAVLDHNYEYAPGFPQLCSTVDRAKEKAAEHYTSLLESFFQ